MQPRGGAYSPDDIEVLQGLEPIRRRPGMYVGDPDDGTGLHEIVFAAVAHAAEEARRATTPRVDVILHRDGAVTVADNGIGLPFEPLPDGRRPFEIYFTQLPLGRSLVDALERAVLSALSSRLDVTVRRDAAIHRQSFAAGVALGPPASSPSDGGATGTTLTFWPDRSIFHPAGVLLHGLVADALARWVTIFPRLTCTLLDEATERAQTFSNEGRAIVARSGRAPVPDADPRSGEFSIDVYVRAADAGEQGAVPGFTNGVLNDGGTHVRAARRALRERAPQLAERARVAVVVWHPSPQYQRRGGPLRIPEVGPLAGRLTRDAVDAWVASSPIVPTRPDDPVESALVARLQERRDDDEAALVLADYLQSRGDPRGELIALEHRIVRVEECADAVARAAELVDRERARIRGRAGGFPFRSRWLGRPFAELSAELREDPVQPDGLRRFLDELTTARLPVDLRTNGRAADALLADAGFVSTGRAVFRPPPDEHTAVERLRRELPPDGSLALSWAFLWSAGALGDALVGLQTSAFYDRALVSRLRLELPSGPLRLDARVPLRHAGDLQTLRSFRLALIRRLGAVPRDFFLELDGGSARGRQIRV